MPNVSARTTMPRNIMAIQLVGLALILTGLLIMFVARPTAASGMRTLFEILMATGMAFVFLFAVRCWQWVRRIRSEGSGPQTDA